jgi:hypothetical protein
MGEVSARATELDCAQTDDKVPEMSDGMGSDRPGLQIAADSVLCGGGVVGVSEDLGGITRCGAMRPAVRSSAVAVPTGRSSTPQSRSDLGSALPGSERVRWVAAQSVRSQSERNGLERCMLVSVAARAADGGRAARHCRRCGGNWT